MPEEERCASQAGDRLFRLLVQGVTDYAIFLLDPSGRISTWNAGAERMKGYAAEEIIGQHFSRFYTPEDRAQGKPSLALKTATETDRFESEGWRVRKDGTRFWASAVIDAIRDDDGSLIGFAKITRDITDRLAAEQALRESEQRFRTLVQGVTDYAIYMLDPQGNVTNWNVGGERIKGYRESEIIGQHFSRFYTEEDRLKGEPARALATAARDERFEREGWRVRKDGTRFWANVIIDPIRDEAGTLVGFAKVTRDMSERKRAEEALEQTRAVLAQAQKMEAVGQLTGGVAHDFNNLLTIITNALDLLVAGPRDESRQRRIIDAAQRAAKRGAKLTQQLLAFSRQQPLRAQVHNVNSVISGFEAVLRRACAESISVDVALSPEPLAVEIDAAQFETALLNLVVNARDAMPSGGRLRIATGVEALGSERAQRMSGIREGECVVVSVSDTGTGMSAEIVSRAFEPFFTTKEIGRGSGLGLSQVYGVMMQSGGHVEIDSRVGAGTSIKLYLPRSKAEPVAESETYNGEARGARAGRILVVEDDPEVLEVTVAMLRHYDYGVVTAPDGPSALAALQRDPDIDILFTDIVMPRGMNGVELARQAMVLHPGLRVLLASGYPASALAGSRGFGTHPEFPLLTKPYRAVELAAKLEEVQREERALQTDIVAADL